MDGNSGEKCDTSFKRVGLSREMNQIPFTSQKSLKRERMIAILSKIALVMFWSFTAWMLLWNVFRVWPGERLWAVALTNYFAPWFMLAMFAIAILMVIFQQKYLFFASLLAAMLIFIRFIPMFFVNSPSMSTGPTYKIMTYNLYKHNSDLEGIVSTIKEEDPDIIGLQELVPDVAARLLEELEERYPYHTLGSDQPVEGQGLMSRYELDQVSSTPDYRFLSAIALLPQGEIAVFNVHAPKITPWRWERAWEDQRSFVQDLFAQTSKIQSPVLIVGDFNTTQLSQNYALLRQEYHDAFADTGNGFGFTYPAREKLGIKLPWALVRIDFIFHNDYLISHETKVLTDSGGSDHRPVISILGIMQ